MIQNYNQRSFYRLIGRHFIQRLQKCKFAFQLLLKLFQLLLKDAFYGISIERLTSPTLNVLGTPSCRHAMYKQAEAIASLLLPFKFLPSCTWKETTFTLRNDVTVWLDIPPSNDSIYLFIPREKSIIAAATQPGWVKNQQEALSSPSSKTKFTKHFL